MKLAVSSSAVDGLLASGALTHLEWLEACAATIDADGVVFVLRHLPRRDAEYLAQLRKNAIDTGLDVVALDVGTLFFGDEDESLRAEAAEIARTLGAPIVLFALGAPGAVPPADVRATTEALKAGTKRAKAANVTLALHARPQTLAGSVAAAKRIVNDVDSAWLRYVDEPLAEEHPAERKTVVAYDAAPAVRDPDRDARLRRATHARRGWLVLDTAGGASDVAAIGARIAALRAKNEED